MSKGARAGALLVSFAALLGLIVFAVAGYLRSTPPTVSATPSSTPGVVNLVMQTDGAVGVGPHPSWVGYFIQDANGAWHQTTLIQLPTHSTVHVTLYEYDSGGNLRNTVWSKIQGTVGNIAYVNGVAENIVNPNSNTGNGIAHTFNVPGLGINVPMYGVSSTAKNFCNAGPCNLSEAHTTITFQFHTGGVGSYRWQCFVPCGLGYVDGNGGPMQNIGYMAGFLKVV
ncbi:hypothetical protein [Acidithrix ferrooxidans]|uniref:Uncharacterized protein n=1 Tax=Acidithrix ferrooxidans TaxID=1280514 RepID=A0A0D8HFP0_9ACTN|nr:hypothetical protein [Acidithrix ferrooxidans]KJF16785.1 hypothetical protein AXFE_23640 [Acidithrix ferrooxidans]